MDSENTNERDESSAQATSINDIRTQTVKMVDDAIHSKLPNWVRPDGKVEPSIFNSPVKRAVAQALRDAGGNGATTTSLAEATDASVRSVKTALYGFDEEGYISRVDNPGPCPDDIYWCGSS